MTPKTNTAEWGHRLPEHLHRLRAPMQVWEYIHYLQDELAKERARVEQAERERDEAKTWIAENWCGEDDDPNEPELVELVKRMYVWGDSGFYVAGMELDRAAKAEADLAACREAIQAADALAERVRRQDPGAAEWGRWRELADYDDARAALTGAAPEGPMATGDDAIVPPADLDRASQLAQERGWRDVAGEGVTSDPDAAQVEGLADDEETL